MQYRAALLAGLASLAFAGAARADTYTVTGTTDDSGATCAASCSLRAAVLAANGHPGGDTVLLPAGNYPLPGGALPVTESLTIQGDGPAATQIDAQTGDRVIDASAGALTIQGVHLARGMTDQNGGAIRDTSGGPLTLENTLFTDNLASGTGRAGGAVYYTGSALTVSGSRFTGNRANATAPNNTSEGGAIATITSHAQDLTISGTTFDTNTATGSFADGGALYAESRGGTRTFSGDSFTDNRAGSPPPPGQGGGSFAGAFDLEGTTSQQTIEDTTVAGNAAYTSGGGAFTAGDLTIKGSTFSSNTVNAIGGGLFAQGDTVSIEHSTFDGNRTTQSGARGAGFMLGVANASVTDSVVTDNTGLDVRGAGGAIESSTAIVRGTVFARNRSEGTGTGGGLYFNSSAGTLTLSESLFAGNLAGNGSGSGSGGGLYASPGGGQVSAVNTTWSGNSAGVASSATASNGGALYLGSAGTVDLRNVTVAGNSAAGNGSNSTAGGIWAADTSQVTVENSIVSGNSAGVAPNCADQVNSAGHNIEHGATSCGFFTQTDQNADPLLAALADNGGPTLTMALDPASPAIDAANGADCPQTDQRGIARPQGAGCDIGAFERVPPAQNPGSTTT
ncbi:MAG: hypothetical protein QOF37_763, partial [Thermoleophilaceae bacterium]|nr:hypothetical protein [Thermoleophilaceae bacterium]